MKHWKPTVLLGAVAVAAAVWAAQAVRVTMDGKVVSTTGRIIDGSLYVRLADVAKAMDRQIVQRNGAYELVNAGGANQLQGTKGRLGEELFTGKWRFLVRDVQRVDKYMLVHADSKFELSAEPGQDLIVVNIRLKNGVQESVNMYFNALGNTALTDMNEQVYTVYGRDIAGGVASMMLPGSAKDFALVFAVPETARVKDLIYTIEPVDASKYGVLDVRISLNP
ncbi:MAG TPA: hypothetical protein VGE01_10085 [Fimbriimonas sp.]